MGRSKKSKKNSDKCKVIDPLTLHVERLPKNITKDEILNLFSIFAPPSRIFLNKTKSFAFIEFENKKITDSVHELAQKKYPEYCIKPAFHKGQAKDKNKVVAGDCKLEEKKPTVDNKSTSTDDIMPLPKSSSYNSQNVSAQALQAKSAAEERLLIMKSLEAVYRRRTLQESGPCSRCFEPTTKTCGLCGVFYCSKDCQLIDWILHQRVCRPKEDILEESYVPKQNQSPSRHISSRSAFTSESLPSESYPKVRNGFSREPEHELERRGGESNRNSRDFDLERNGSAGESVRRGSSSNNRNKTDRDFERNSSAEIDRSVRNDDYKKSYEDKEAQPRSHERFKDSGAELFKNRKDFNKPGESWESNDMKEKPSPKRRTESPRRPSPPSPRKTRDSPRKRSPSPVRRRHESPRKRSPSPVRRRRESPRKRSPSPVRRRQESPKRQLSPPVLKRFSSEETEAEVKPVKSEIKKESPKVKKVEKSKPEVLSVIGLVRESKDSYWVLEYDDLDSWQHLQSDLQDVCKKAPPIEPEIGLVCGCFYDDMWYRGKIITVRPEIKIHYIDYGNTSECDSNIKKLPDHLVQSPGLAFLIKFDKGTPKKYETENFDGENFRVEVQKDMKDYYLIRFPGVEYPIVKEEEEKKEPPVKRMSAQARLAALSKPKRKNVWDSLNEGSTGLLNITSGIGRTVYGSLVPEEDEIAIAGFDEIDEFRRGGKVLEIFKEPGIVPKVGDLVLAAASKELIGRGEVLCKAGSSYIINLIDYAQCVKNKEIHPLPDNFKNFPAIGVKIHIVEVFSKTFDLKYVQKEETYFFVVTGPCEDNKWPCLIKSTDTNPVKVAKGQIEKWTPPIVQLSYIPIESGSSVVLSALISLRTAYVKPACEETNAKLNSISREVNEYASRGIKCEEPPSVGQMVCARFSEDGEYYRAVVESIKGNLFNVRFVDYGNDQETELKDLLPLPKKFQEYPCFATKIYLKGIEKEAYTQEVEKYLSKLNSRNIELIMTYDKNEVILTEKETEVIVNDLIKEKLAASRR